jgi:hypothetical protein
MTCFITENCFLNFRSLEYCCNIYGRDSYNKIRFSLFKNYNSVMSIIVLFSFELSTDYNQILNNLTQSFGREAAISLR